MATVTIDPAVIRAIDDMLRLCVYVRDQRDPLRRLEDILLDRRRAVVQETSEN